MSAISLLCFTLANVVDRGTDRGQTRIHIYSRRGQSDDFRSWSFSKVSIIYFLEIAAFEAGFGKIAETRKSKQNFEK